MGILNKKNHKNYSPTCPLQSVQNALHTNGPENQARTWEQVNQARTWEQVCDSPMEGPIVNMY